ncbi:MAG: prepilin-type N-terminal cleavage/methylation domain-containing protein [Acidimicrobiia bacterium]
MAKNQKVRHLAARLQGEERGFGLIELVISISVLGLVSLAFAAGMSSSLRAFTTSRAETLASQVATRYVESIRQLPYDDVGLVGGNPPGTIPVTIPTQTVDNYRFTLAVDVSYVDDPVPTAAATLADYKRVVVTVTQVGKTKAEATLETLVAPPSAASSTKAVVKVLVQDIGVPTGIQGATVNLLNGPSSPRSDVTDSQGYVTFPDLTPNPASGATQYYDLSATAPGYTTLPDDVVPASTVRKKLLPSDSISPVIRMYKPVTIVVNLRTTAGTPFTGSSNVTVTSPRGDQTFTVTGGSATITTIDSELLVPGEYSLTATATASGTNYESEEVTANVPSAYPTNLTSTIDLTMADIGPATASLTINTRRSSGGSGSGCNFTGTKARNNQLNVVITGGPLGGTINAKTNNGTVTVQVPIGAAAYTVTIPKQGSYQGSGTKVVTAATTCNLEVG